MEDNFDLIATSIKNAKAVRYYFFCRQSTKLSSLQFNNFFDGDVVYGNNLYYYEDKDVDEYLKDHDDISKQVIKMKISGHTQEEIKRKLNISVNQIKKILN